MMSDLDSFREQSSICMHKLCIDCPLLPMCKKDANDYDPEKVREYLASIHCPQCGFVLFQTADGHRICLICDWVSKKDAEIARLESHKKGILQGLSKIDSSSSIYREGRAEIVQIDIKLKRLRD